MKKNILTLIATQVFPLLLTGALAVAANKPELQKLQHTVHSSMSEQVVLQLNGSYIPKVFTLKGETPRIIFDFPDMTYGKEIKGSTITKGAIVKRIRVGMHTDEALKTRVVFDVATLNGVSYTQKFDEKSSSLVIQFASTAKAVALKTDSKTETATNKSGSEETLTETTMAAQPEATVDATVTSKGMAPPTNDDVAPQPIEKITTPQPTVTTEDENKKKSLPSPATQPQTEENATAKTSAPSKPSQTDTEVKSQPATKEPPPQPAETALKTDEKKKSPLASATQPQSADTASQKISAKTEGAKPATVTNGAGGGPLLESIKFDGNSPKGEMVLFKLNDFHPPTIHGVEEGIPRVICDFNNTQLSDSTKSILKTDGKLVKVIRITKHKNPDRVRVVLDLEPNRSYDLQQVFFKEDNLFVIIVNTVKK